MLTGGPWWPASAAMAAVVAVTGCGRPPSAPTAAGHDARQFAVTRADGGRVTVPGARPLVVDFVSAGCVTGVATAAALAQGALFAAIGRLARYLPRISGALLAASGLYLAVYWIPALLRRGTTPGTDPLSAVSAAISTWTGAHENLVTAGAALLVIAAVIAAVLAARRSRPGQPDACRASGSSPAPATLSDGPAAGRQAAAGGAR